MATELATAYISLVPSFRGGTKGIEKQLGGVGASAGTTAGGGFKSSFGKAAMAGGGLIAGAVIVKQFTSAFKAASESRKISALTEQVIKSTGGAAKITADQVSTLAESLASKTGVDDEVIQSGENLLLTFANIRNEAGKGNDIFNQTTSLANDMSVALGQDMKSSSLQLGKALNDPIKGVGALSRAGVSFTEQQKDQIKALQSSGDLLGAQKIILAEVSKEFGGAATAAATPMDKLKVLAGNLQEKVGGALLPVIDRAAVWIGTNLPVAIAGAKRLFEQWKPSLVRVGEIMRTVAERVGPIVTAIVNFAKKEPGAVFAGLGVILGGVVLAAVVALTTAVIALFSPVVLIVGGIALLAAGVVYAYKHFEGFRAVVDAVKSWLVGTAWPAIQLVATSIGEVFGQLVNWVRSHWGAIQEAIGHVVNVVKTVIDVFVAQVTWVWQTFGDSIMAGVKAVWGQVVAVVKFAVALVQGIIETVLAVINGDWGQAWDAIKGVASAALDLVVSSVSGAMTFVTTLISDALALGKSIVAEGLDSVVGLFTGLADLLAGALSKLAAKVAAPFLAMGEAIKDAWNNSIGGKGFDIPDIPGVPGGGTRVEVPRLHSGGMVSGRAGQEVLRILEAGEMVLSRGDVARMNAPVRQPAMAGAVSGGGMQQIVQVTTVANANADEVVQAINAKLGWMHTTRRDR